ncbi:MAG: hypothetical protein QM747_02745 [Nocardioides sp.]
MSTTKILLATLSLLAVSLVNLSLGAPAEAAAPAAASGVLYVSPTGDDGATGTRQAPLRTPQVAVDALPDGGTVYLLPGTYPQERIVLAHQHDLTVAATKPGRAVLDASGLQPLLDDSGVVQISDSARITIRGLDIRGYRTTSMKRVPIGIYVTGHDQRVTLAHNHVHRLGNDNGTLGSFDINAHGIAVYGRDPSRPISHLRIVGERGRPPAPRRQRERRRQRQRRPLADHAQPRPRRRQHRHRRHRLGADPDRQPPLHPGQPGTARSDRAQPDQPHHQPGEPGVLGGRRLVQLRRRHLRRRR